ncbi:phage tail protein [Weissella oryzae SG25]|uniref:Phage tail protein n=1 Tax=Weissella oryzae (strain DSM 25784 / JCM 18191 / LMG 30913 / SG25) TaxID=1329250 RepID=A0A069CS22_WEIOS|nr:phage tail protein [Weissella oryzae]GAK30219.1 phage tail protein [Weissella oryzae SG25]
MAQVGLHRTFLANIDKVLQTILKGEAGLSEDGLFEVTTAMLGTKTANITNISTNGTPIYGNNTKVDQTQAKGEPSVALDFNNLPFEIKQKLLGRISDGKGGYLQEERPQVALLIESQTLDRKNSIYYGLANGEMQENAVNVQTDTNNEVRADDALTFTSFGVDKWNGEAMKVYFSGDAKFDKAAMLADVFGGYTDGTKPDTSGDNKQPQA